MSRFGLVVRRGLRVTLQFQQHGSPVLDEVIPILYQPPSKASKLENILTRTRAI